MVSGSVMGWGDPLVARLTRAVFVTMDGDARLARLRAREAQRLGDLAALEGAALAAHEAFMDWAAGYDDPDFQGRNRRRHEAFLSELPCPVIRVDGGLPVDQVLARVVAALDG